MQTTDTFLFVLLQFVGYNDEVLDVKFLGKAASHIVVATNSCQLKVFELLTNSCQILYGHTGELATGGSMCLSETTWTCVFLFTRNQSFILFLIEVIFFVCFTLEVKAYYTLSKQNSFSLKLIS